MKHFSEISATAERVVDAAEGLIQQRGYNGFSYDDVARLVGIKKPSIHHHFATKSELAAVVAQRYTHRFREQLLEIEGRSAQAAERLTAYAALFEKTFSVEKHLCVCGMLGAEAGSLPEQVNHEVTQFFEVNLAWLRSIAAQGQRAGQLSSVLDAQSIAQTYLALLEGAMIVGRGMQQAAGPSNVASHFLKTLTPQ